MASGQRGSVLLGGALCRQCFSFVLSWVLWRYFRFKKAGEGLVRDNAGSVETENTLNGGKKITVIQNVMSDPIFRVLLVR